MHILKHKLTLDHILFDEYDYDYCKHIHFTQK